MLFTFSSLPFKGEGEKNNGLQANVQFSEQIILPCSLSFAIAQQPPLSALAF